MVRREMRVDHLGREVLSPTLPRSDWVKVMDEKGYVSYIPRGHLKDDGHLFMTGVSYMLSLTYLVPFVRFLLG